MGPPFQRAGHSRRRPSSVPPVDLRQEVALAVLEVVDKELPQAVLEDQQEAMVAVGPLVEVGRPRGRRRR